MNPPSEQLVRDYLNRVSVAARGKLGSAERREFLARMRESIERQTGVPGTTELIDVGKLLSALGEPRALVERERARLAQLQGLPDSATPRSAQLAARPAAWRPHFSLWRSADVVVPSDAGQAPASEAPPGGEVRVQSRPIMPRRQPGEPMEPLPSGPQRPPWTVNGAEHPGKEHPGEEHPGEEHPGKEHPGTEHPGKEHPGEEHPGEEHPGEEHPGKQRAEGSAPEEPQRESGPQGEPDRPGEPGRQARGRQAPWAIRERVRRSLRRSRSGGSADGPTSAGAPRGPAPGAPPAPAGPRRWSLRPGAEPERTARMARLRAALAAAWPAGGSGRLAAARAGLGSIAGAAATLARCHPLEAFAIVLLGLGGLVYPPIWLIGACMALLSRDWDIRDKWVGLAGPVLLMIVGTGLLVALGGHRDSVHLYVREAWMIADYLSRAGAVLGAAYLTWRTQRGPREPPVPPWSRTYRI